MTIESEFDKRDAFKQLCEAWLKKPRPKEKESYEVEFNKRVKDETTWNNVWKAAELAISDKKYKPLGIWLCDAFPIKALEEDVVEFAPAIDGQQKPLFEPNSRDEFFAKLKNQSLYSIDRSEEDLQKTFQSIWNNWPQHSKYSEDPVQAFTGFRVLSLSVPLDDILSTCNFYKKRFYDPSSGMIEPYHLSNFMSRDKFMEWNEQYNHMPHAEDLEVFEATWAWYPKFHNRDAGKPKEDSMAYWFRHIKPEDRWAFLSAVKRLRSDRKEVMFVEQKLPEEIEKYTPSMVSFIGAWQELKHFRIMAGDMAKGCLPILKSGNFLATGQLYDVGVGLEDYLAARLVKYKSDARLTYAALARYIREELTTYNQNRPEFDSDETFDTFVQKLYAAGWEQACKPPRVVLR